MEVVDMIPILYEETEVIFNHNGIGLLDESIVCEVTEVLNGAFDLYLEYPSDGRWAKELKDFRIISAKPNDRDEPHNFRIYEIEKDLNPQTIYVYATSITNDLGGNMVTEVSMTGTPKQIMDEMKENLVEPTSLNFESDITTVSSVNWLRRNPINCLVGEEGSLVHIFKGELKRTNDLIHFYRRRGTDNVTTIRQGKNIRGFKLKTSTKGMITRILPYFSYYEESEEETGEQEVITVVGNIVDSPLVNNYPIRSIVPVEYGEEDGVYDLDTLNQVAAEYFQTRNPGCDKPSVKMEVDLVQLSDTLEYERFRAFEHIEISDTVDVWVEKFDVDTNLKIIEVVYNSLAEKVQKIVAGDKPTSQAQASQNTYSQQIDQLEKYLSENIASSVRMAANRNNRIFSGPDEPPLEISKKNDTWFKSVADGKSEIWVFNGVEWVPEILSIDTSIVEGEIADAKALAQAAKDAADAVGDSWAVQNLNEAGDIVSQLNLTDGTFLIEADKIIGLGDVIIDGKMTITDEFIAPNAQIDGAKIKDATIGSAKIIELDADKVTAGDIELNRGIRLVHNGKVIFSAKTPTEVYMDEDIKEELKGDEGPPGESAYKVELLTSNGSAFKNGVINTIIMARVYYGGEDITDEIDINRFRWRRVSNDPAGDSIWNDRYFGGVKEIEITRDDVNKRATFSCEILKE
jgi:phage minor structural protein